MRVDCRAALLAAVLLGGFHDRTSSEPADGDATLATATPDSTATFPSGPPGRDPALAVGERLVFSVRWGKVPAGEATLSIQERTEVDGHPCLRVVSTASSSQVFDKVYPVRDRIESLMDSDSLWSWRFEKHLREGRYRQDQVIRMDHDAGTATYHNGNVYPIPRGTHDVLSAFYRVRTMPLRQGEVIYLDSHSDKKNYPIKVTVVGQEDVEVPAGRFRCWVLEPTLRSGAFFKHEGRLTIWLTDDARRIPVQMKSKIPVGSISVVLTSMERPAAP